MYREYVQYEYIQYIGHIVYNILDMSPIYFTYNVQYIGHICDISYTIYWIYNIHFIGHMSTILAI